MNHKDKKGYLKPPVNPHHEPLVDDYNRMIESLHEHDDRSMVLNLAAFAEDTLELLLLAFLREPKQAKELVNGFNAPLGTFSARIKAAFVLGLVHKRGYEAIEALRKIRNHFAHNWEGVSLDRADIKSLLASLPRSRFEGIDPALLEGADSPYRERLKYRVSDVLIDLRMLIKALAKSGANAPMVISEMKLVRPSFVEVSQFSGEAPDGKSHKHS